MLELSYILEGGKVVRLKDDKLSSRPRDSLGFAFDDSDRDMIVLHKHGDPEKVKAWLEDEKLRLAKVGSLGAALADKLQFIEVSAFPNGFPIMLVNEAIAGQQPALRALLRPQDTIDMEVGHGRLENSL